MDLKRFLQTWIKIVLFFAIYIFEMVPQRRVISMQSKKRLRIAEFEGTPQFKLIGNQIWAYFTLGEAYFGNAYSYFQIRRIWVRRIWRTLKKAYLCVITTKYEKHLTTCDRVVPCTAIVEILLIPCKYSTICRIQLHSKNQGNTNTFSYFWIRLNTFLYDVIV